jgi:Methyltransferase domain
MTPITQTREVAKDIPSTSRLRSAMAHGLSVGAPQLNALLLFLSDELDRHGISGNIGEIGVAGGNFFIPLALCCAEEEVAVAIDVFEHHPNWDATGGSATTAQILTLAEQNGVRPIVRFVSGDSLYVEDEDILAAGGSRKFKLFSVDGAHSVHHTVSDLEIAERFVAPGGIVFLDDISNWGWPGVFEGFARYSLLRPLPRLVPFLAFGNKVILTTASHQAGMLDLAIRYAESLGRQAGRTYRVSRFFNWDIVGW